VFNSLFLKFTRGRDEYWINPHRISFVCRTPKGESSSVTLVCGTQLDLDGDVIEQLNEYARRQNHGGFTL
jgi:hypothetical protein